MALLVFANLSPAINLFVLKNVFAILLSFNFILPQIVLSFDYYSVYILILAIVALLHFDSIHNVYRNTLRDILVLPHNYDICTVVYKFFIYLCDFDINPVSRSKNLIKLIF